MIEDITIEREGDEAQGRYVARLEGGAEAEMTFFRREDGALVADHTYVPPPFRGRGIAEQLVKRAIADARTAGDKILPLCSFVAAQFRHHPDWEDLRAPRGY
jgi:predicted GNAT family acetyltransferase